MRTLTASTTKSPIRRLLLRPYRPSDYDMIFSLFQDERVMRYVFLGRPYTDAEFREFVAKYMERLAEDPLGIGLIVDLDSGKLLGCAGITPLEYRGVEEHEFGIALAYGAQGEGIGKSICQALLDYGRSLGFPRLLATCHHENTASKALLQRLNLMLLSRDELFANRKERDVYATAGLLTERTEC